MPNEPIEKDPDDTTDKPPFRESAEVLLAMWNAGEYPNPSDAVQDCKALLYAVPPEHASYRPQLEAILEQAVLQAAKLAAARAAMPDPPSERLISAKRAPAPAKKSAPPTTKKTLPPVAKKVPAKKASAKKAPAKKAPTRAANKPAKRAAPKRAPARQAKKAPKRAK